MFKTQEDFESCDKLFQLLNNNITDARMCTVIILIINAIADSFAQDSTKCKFFISIEFKFMPKNT